MRTTTEFEGWKVEVRKNQSGNLTVEVSLDGQLHADLILQAGGVIDLGTTGRPWDTGPKGWAMPGAPSTDWRKYRFGPKEDSE